MYWQTLQSQLGGFADKLRLTLEELGIQEQCTTLEIDHICIRLQEISVVDAIKTEFDQIGQTISAVNVNGREIVIIQLDQALNLGSWQTYGVELPYPKPQHTYEDGWEHVEFVLPHAENTISGVRQAFQEAFPHLDLSQLKSEYAYTEEEPLADGNQIPNPTVGLKVNGVGLKFHAHPIQFVVGFTD